MKRAALVALAALLLGACVRSGASGEPDVYAAASLAEVFTAIEPGARFNFAGSDQLATQIREGAGADVFASASPRYTSELMAEGLVLAPTVFATNRLVLAVGASEPARIRSVEDLRRTGVRLVVGAPNVPIGVYTRQLLTAMDAEEVLDRVVSEEQDAAAVAGKVALGEADAGIVYATDIGPGVRAVELPSAAQPTIAYTVAITRDARHPEAARAFIAALVGERGRRALADAGFGLP